MPDDSTQGETVTKFRLSKTTSCDFQSSSYKKGFEVTPRKQFKTSSVTAATTSHKTPITKPKPTLQTTKLPASSLAYTEDLRTKTASQIQKLKAKLVSRQTQKNESDLRLYKQKLNPESAYAKKIKLF